MQRLGIHFNVTSRPRHGVATIELAIVLPILITLAILVIDVGHLGYFSYAVSNATRSAAVYASTNRRTEVNVTRWQSELETIARAEFNGMNGYEASRLSIATTPEPSVKMTANEYSVTCRYQYRPIISWPGSASTILIERTSVFPSHHE